MDTQNQDRAGNLAVAARFAELHHAIRTVGLVRRCELDASNDSCFSVNGARIPRDAPPTPSRE